MTLTSWHNLSCRKIDIVTQFKLSWHWHCVTHNLSCHHIDTVTHNVSCHAVLMLGPACVTEVLCEAVFLSVDPYMRYVLPYPHLCKIYFIFNISRFFSDCPWAYYILSIVMPIHVWHFWYHSISKSRFAKTCFLTWKQGALYDFQISRACTVYRRKI